MKRAAGHGACIVAKKRRSVGNPFGVNSGAQSQRGRLQPFFADREARWRRAKER